MHCNNCQARLVPYHRTKEDAETETIHLEKSDLCAGHQAGCL
jgi:hypothetical protein